MLNPNCAMRSAAPTLKGMPQKLACKNMAFLDVASAGLEVTARVLALDAVPAVQEGLQR